MFRKLLIAGVVLSTFSTPTLGATWHVVKSMTGGSYRHNCMVLPRPASFGERSIGTFESKTRAIRLAKSRTCNNRNYRKSNDRRRR